MEQQNQPKKWLTAPEAAAILEISEAALYARVRRKQIRAWKLGGSIRFLREDLEAAITPTTSK